MTDGSVNYFPIEVPNPDPLTYRIFQTGPKGGTTFLPRNILKYLGALGVCYDGPTPRKFDGRAYCVLREYQLHAIIHDAVDAYQTQTLITSSQMHSIEEAGEAILSADRLPTFDDPKDADAYCVVEDGQVKGSLLAFENGILNTATDELLPFTRHLLVRSCYATRYDPSIKDCQARKHIENILPDPDTRRFFYEMVGYILFGAMNPPGIFVIYGPGNTGKSALSNMIMTLMGPEMVSTISLNQLTDKFMPAMLEGKQLNVSGETGEGKNRFSAPDGEMIKQLSDGQYIMVQRKHGHPYPLKNTAKLLFVSNTVPNFGDTSSGLYRRLYTIPCRVPQNQRLRIYDQMTDPDSLSWLVNVSYQAFKDFMDAGGVFRPSEEMRIEWSNMRAHDPFYDFLFTLFDSTDIHEICLKIVGHDVYKRTKALYDAYKEYCYTNQAHPLSSRKFYERIRNETDLDIRSNPMNIYIDGVCSSVRVFEWKKGIKDRPLPPKIDDPTKDNSALGISKMQWNPGE